MKNTALQKLESAVLEIEAAKQRVIKRNWRFSLVPGIALCVSLIALIWEVIRQNMSTPQWPWTIQLIGVAPAATLSGLFASLILAREQFARSMRPNLSWSCRLQQTESLGGQAWTAILMNVGPGIAHVEATGYSLRLKRDLLVREADAASRPEAIELLAQYGLLEGHDFQLRMLTAGAPLPVVTNAAEGIEFAALNENAIAVCRKIDFHVTVVDMMGDRHAKSLPFIATLPPLKVGALVPPVVVSGQRDLSKK